jgi:phosphotransferase system  glucose/maltose/N-acetylglucosamine-specific IIC component
MNTRLKILNATKWAGGITFITGMMIFLYGILSHVNPVIGIGIGTIIGSVFFFLIGMFFIATEEMVESTSKGIEIPTVKPRNRLYLVKK